MDISSTFASSCGTLRVNSIVWTAMPTDPKRYTVVFDNYSIVPAQLNLPLVLSEASKENAFSNLG